LLLVSILDGCKLFRLSGDGCLLFVFPIHDFSRGIRFSLRVVSMWPPWGALACKDVPDRVKLVIKHLLVCMSHVVGSNAHRTYLRHVNVSYTLLFGPPLVFTTPNIADTRQPMMSLLYENGSVARWHLLEEHDPEMPAMQEMLRRVASDPVSQAVLFDEMMRLFFRHILGVDLPRGQGYHSRSDGIASEFGRGIFGVVQAFLAPIETQGRGGLHAHIHVWVLHPLVIPTILWLAFSNLQKLHVSCCRGVIGFS
jgi:hypothetical protein